MKLHKQLKKQKVIEKKQISAFCDQFAFDMPKSSRWLSKEEQAFPKRKKEHQNSEKVKRKYREEEPPTTNKRVARKLLAKVKCHNYGKFGHYATNCWKRNI